ncbi:DGQHR domain-containing protein [Aeromicrobium endophyticum]|uniref:DGQHR domain-containing protein n=1 Tax=Aeromicrobium endophyticum TaxID=2292704 RepID=A0A371P1U3_9ACTN|nr:DGQHR domain-containing protein [Aeromicrobium endophyticum]REK69885.1 DGQHR domain-containing protein [Aeromicrobium endophyticum]
MHPSVRIDCLKDVVHTAKKKYPVYVGFARPSDLVKVAVAPAYGTNDPHREIAQRVLQPPVSSWQRPLENARVTAIADVFSSSDEIMPNPVLLSANIDHAGLEPKVLNAPDGTPTTLWQIDVPIPQESDAKPLWILDGQHRINGLAKSSQADNPIPIVLLLNAPGQTAYSGRDFAHIFAQVTVTAKGLNPIHEEWLTYSYELDRYAPTVAGSEAHRSSFEAVAHLCGDVSFSTPDPNPWLNGIVFNPEQGTTPPATLAGFHYSSPELKDLILKHFYLQNGILDPQELAEQLALAYSALTKAIAMPHDESVFFGKGTYAHKVMQDGFIVGVLRRLAHLGPPNSWLDLFRSLNFHKTDWNFNTWASTRGGNAGNTSRKLAETIFPNVMIQGILPDDIDNLADYFRGNNAQVTVLFRHTTTEGRPIKKDYLLVKLMNGNKPTRDIGDRRHMKILQPGREWSGAQSSPNVGKVEAYEPNAMGRPRKFSALTGSGINLAELDSTSLEVNISMEHYGAEFGNASLTVKWS